MSFLVTPHATVFSAFHTHEFITKLTEVKNEWYSIMNMLRKCYLDLPKIDPVLEICGSATSLKDLNSVACGTLTRTRVNRTQRVTQYSGTVLQLQRLYPIQHLISSLFKDAPLPRCFNYPVDSRSVPKMDRFLFYTETLPLQRMTICLDQIDGDRLALCHSVDSDIWNESRTKDLTKQ